MCPLCLSITVLVVAGATSTGSIAALIARTLYIRKKGDRHVAEKNRDAR